MGIVDKAKEALGISDADVDAAKAKAEQAADKIQDSVNNMDQATKDRLAAQGQQLQDKAKQVGGKIQDGVNNMDQATKDRIAANAQEAANKAKDVINDARSGQ